MVLLEFNCGFNNLLAGIGSCAAVFVTLIIFIISTIISSHRENKNNLMHKFNDIYYKTFNLRDEMSRQFLLPFLDEEFYYEIDHILDNPNIQTKILDYLNEMENLFAIVKGKFFLNKPFKKLMSYALYARLSVFYGYIIKMRKLEHNDKKLVNYITVINRVEKMHKIKRQAKIKGKKYYIGIRNSDVDYDGNYFYKSITMFAHTSKSVFAVRLNQNMNAKEFIPYIKRKIEKIMSRNPNNKIMFYNGSIAYKLPNEMRKNIICLNERELINFLNDKILCKLWLFNSGIPIVEYETILGKELANLGQHNFFNKAKKFVLQDSHGGGGIGTYLLSKNNFNQIKSQLNPLKQYMLSPYLENSISLNTHVFISDKQTILTPASVQIIELKNNQLCYRGADFFAFESISKKSKDEIKKLSLKIANLLRSRGYRGVAGIDFIISNTNEVFCAEINPRFQASSILLDLYLCQESKEKNDLAHSIYELNEQAFKNNLKSDISFDDKIKYSCYYYYKDEVPEKYLKEKAKQLKQGGAIVCLDGLNFNKKQQFNKNSYMFRAIFTHPICTISLDNELWVSNNITINEKPKDILDLKIALLNQGVQLTHSNKNIKKGVYESVDISFQGIGYCNSPIDINCAYGVNLSQYSPFKLDCKNNKLFYYDEELGFAKAEINLLSGFSTVEKKILYLATDRLRINLVSGCEFKNFGKGCKFCNVPISTRKFEFSEIIEALKKLKGNKIIFRHILIGGGTCVDDDVWSRIINITHWLQSDDFYKDKPISLMSILPPAKELQNLRNAGITEVAFNLEISDSALAKLYMGGKCYNKNDFYAIMDKAVKIFGYNNVRSALIVGLNKTSDLVSEVRVMAQRGILPCLSAFRVLHDTEIQIKIPPSNSYLRKTFEKCLNILRNSGFQVKDLGPLCKRCGNNMLII